MKLQRSILHKITARIDDKRFVIIVGARQTGKTTILKQIGSFLADRNDTYFFLTLEDITVLSKLNEHPENIFGYISKPTDNEHVYVLIDEIQYLENPTNFLKLLYDKFAENLKIIATGSSAFYIDTKFKDSLAGRKQLFEIRTLTFDEFLYFKTGRTDLNTELQRIRLNSIFLSLHRVQLSVYFDEYLTYGGYPAVVLADTHEMKIEILTELMNSYIKRDISEANIQNPDKFYRLLKILAEQTGNLLNVNELATTLGVSTTSINNYLYVLQKCFHIDLLKPFYKNLRKELTKMPKVYFGDLGLRNILLNLFQQPENRIDRGELLENYLFLRLCEQFGADNLRFWRTATGNEVDFVVVQNSESGFAVESKFSMRNFAPKHYEAFTNNYPLFPLQCRCYENSSNETWALAL